MMDLELVAEILKPHEAKLCQLPYAAWSRLEAIRPHLPVNGYLRDDRTLMYSYMHDVAIEQFSACPDVELLSNSQNFRLRIERSIIVRLNHGKPMGGYANNPTQLSMAFDSQASVPGVRDGVNLRLLYHTDEFNAEITRVSLVCPDGPDTIAWEYDLSLIHI